MNCSVNVLVWQTSLITQKERIWHLHSSVIHFFTVFYGDKEKKRRRRRNLWEKVSIFGCGVGARVQWVSGIYGDGKPTDACRCLCCNSSLMHIRTHRETHTHATTLPPLVYCNAPAVVSTYALGDKGKTERKRRMYLELQVRARIREQNTC